jgi:hypothetical protein
MQSSSSKKRKYSHISSSEDEEEEYNNNNNNALTQIETLKHVFTYLPPTEQVYNCRLVNKKWCHVITSHILPRIALRFIRLLYYEYPKTSAQKKRRTNKKNKYRPTNLVLPASNSQFTWNFGENSSRIEMGNDVLGEEEQLLNQSLNSSLEDVVMLEASNSQCMVNGISNDSSSSSTNTTKKELKALHQLMELTQNRMNELVQIALNKETIMKQKFAIWNEYAKKTDYNFMREIRPDGYPDLLTICKDSLIMQQHSIITVDTVLNLLYSRYDAIEDAAAIEAYLETIMGLNFGSCKFQL